MKTSAIVRASFEAAHRLMNHPGHCKNIHGHSYRLEVRLSRHYTEDILTDEGIVVDFSAAKEAVAKVLYYFDHAIILEKKDPLTQVLTSAKLREQTGIVMRVEILQKPPTAEVLAGEILSRLQDKLEYPLLVDRVRLWETENNSVEVTP